MELSLHQPVCGQHQASPYSLNLEVKTERALIEINLCCAGTRPCGDFAPDQGALDRFR